VGEKNPHGQGLGLSEKSQKKKGSIIIPSQKGESTIGAENSDSKSMGKKSSSLRRKKMVRNGVLHHSKGVREGGISFSGWRWTRSGADASQRKRRRRETVSDPWSGSLGDWEFLEGPVLFALQEEASIAERSIGEELLLVREESNQLEK